ncbi:hypothetical protein HDV02_001139 [Globomyces sp. JEL0801]|nr:hypothetical protein HDV02_001139 [Globomyces sp. JEL0801]
MTQRRFPMLFKHLLLALSTIAQSSTIFPLGKTKSVYGTALAGVTYNPLRTTNECVTVENIDEDLQLISKYAKSIRMYAVGCQDAAILSSAFNHGLDVTMGLWVDFDSWNSFGSQLDTFKKTLVNIAETNPAHLKALKSVVVGNEAIFRNEQTPESLAQKITIVRDLLKELNLNDVQLTTAEITSAYENQKLIDAVDFLLPNIHVFFDGYTPIQAPGWFFAKYQRLSNLVASQNKTVVVGEVGWPSAGEPFQQGSLSVPSIANAKFFLNAFACEANRIGIPYFYFDAFNSDYKQVPHSSEYHWGLGYSNRTIKDYVDPALNCSMDSYNGWPKVALCGLEPFDPTVYTCTEGQLCPVPLVGCKGACYDPTKLTCANGVLGPIV